MKNIFKRLFCKHNYVLESTKRKSYKRSDFSEPCYIIEEITCYTYRCTLCGKTKKVYK